MERNNLRFLHIGLGSMGKRRIRNLLWHGIPKEHIFGFDMSGERGKEAEEKYGIKTFTNFDEAVQTANPDAYIISTPPNLHHEYFLYAAKHRKHFFVEVTTVDSGYKELELMLDGSFVAAPSCTFRYFPAIKKIKEIVNSGQIGKILTFQYHLGQYLPDWHPWEDYRQVYFAQKETGACREMFGFELIWLTHLLQSSVKDVAGFTDKVSELEMSADDVYAAALRFENGVMGTMMIEVLARTPFRTLRLIGTEGVLEWEWLEYRIRVFDAKAKTWEIISIPKGPQEPGYVSTEDMYQEEIGYFLDAIETKSAYPYTFAEDQRILKTLYTLENKAKS